MYHTTQVVRCSCLPTSTRFKKRNATFSQMGSENREQQSSANQPVRFLAKSRDPAAVLAAYPLLVSPWRRPSEGKKRRPAPQRGPLIYVPKRPIAIRSVHPVCLLGIAWQPGDGCRRAHRGGLVGSYLNGDRLIVCIQVVGDGGTQT